MHGGCEVHGGWVSIIKPWLLIVQSNKWDVTSLIMVDFDWLSGHRLKDIESRELCHLVNKKHIKAAHKILGYCIIKQWKCQDPHISMPIGDTL